VKYGAGHADARPFHFQEYVMTVAALSAILAQRSIHSLFQPIMCLSEQRVFGHEALSHGPSNNSLHAPLNLFSIARQAGRDRAGGRAAANNQAVSG